MKRILIIILILLFTSTAFCASPYYCDCSDPGVDSGSAGTFADPFVSIKEVNNTSFAEGDDVYFKVGETCEATEYLNVDWEGNSENSVIIGAYEGDGDFTMEGTETLPILKGTRETVYPLEGTGVPSTAWKAMVYAYQKDYITVQDLNVQYSNWSGIRLHTTDGSNILRCEISYTNSQAASIEYGNQDDARTVVGGDKISQIAYNTITETNLLEGTGGLDRAYDIGGQRSRHLWIHHNTISATRGEQIGIYNSSSSGTFGDSTIEYNKLSGWKHACIYIANNGYNLVQYNEAIHGNVENYHKFGGAEYNNTNWGGSGLAMATESQYQASQVQSNVWRGNIISGAISGVYWTSGESSGDDWDNNLVYNNTVYGNFRQLNIYGNVVTNLDATGSGNEIKNNIFANSPDSEEEVNGTPPSSVDFNYNLFTAEVHANATGGNDPTPADPKFTDTDNNDFTLLSTSTAIDAGLTIGADYDDGLSPDSTWPDGVTLLDQDLFGAGWDIGAYVYALFISGTSPTGTGIGLDTDLNWTNPTGTVTVDVYFEKDDSTPDVLVVDGVDVETYDPGTMDENSTYYWQVNVNHAGGTETGVVYEFTTTTGPPAPPAGLSNISFLSNGANIGYSSKGISIERD